MRAGQGKYFLQIYTKKIFLTIWPHFWIHTLRHEIRLYSSLTKIWTFLHLQHSLVWKGVDYWQHYRRNANILIFIALKLRFTRFHPILVFIEFMQTTPPPLFNIILSFILLQSKIISVTNRCVVPTFLLSANIKTLIFTWNIIILSQNIEQMIILKREENKYFPKVCIALDFSVF